MTILIGQPLPKGPPRIHLFGNQSYLRYHQRSTIHQLSTFNFHPLISSIKKINILIQEKLQKIKGIFTDGKHHSKKQKSGRDPSTNSNISPGSTTERPPSGSETAAVQGQKDTPNGLSSNPLDGTQGTHLRASNASATATSLKQPKVVAKRGRPTERSLGPKSINNIVAQKPNNNVANNPSIAVEPSKANPKKSSGLKKVKSF